MVYTTTMMNIKSQTEQKKSGNEEYMLHEFIYIKLKKMQIKSMVIESTSVVAWEGEFWKGRERSEGALALLWC